MTLPKFTSRAMDLSGIAAAAKAPPVPPCASFVLDVDEANFEAVMQLSGKHPVIVELYSPRANAQSLTDDLERLRVALADKPQQVVHLQALVAMIENQEG